MTKITIVGAGSNFTLGLLGDFYRVNDLWGSEIFLYDINEERLRIMEKIITSHVERTKVNLKVNATTNKAEALENSDFVILTIRTGGTEALRKFLEIPLRHGMIAVVGDTVGPSGILKGIFEIPSVLDIARTLEDLSPKALMINFTNPMTPICTSILRGTKMSIVGLCHGIYGISSLASKLLDLEFEKIIPEAGGINHLTWVTSLKYDDEDILSELKQAVISGKRWNVIESHPYITSRYILMAYKHLLTNSDRHTSEFFPYLYEWFKDPKISEILKRVSHYIDYEKNVVSERVLQGRAARWEKLQKIARGEETIKIRPSREGAVDIISAIVNGKRRELVAVNLPNASYIEGVPNGFVVETPGIVDGNGVRGRKIGKLSSSVLAILNLHLQKFELMVQGILEKDKSLILEAMVIDPITTSQEKANVILEEFLSETKGLLPINLS